MPYFKDADDVYANLGLFMRQLAVDLKVNANTVAKVYAELERSGVLATQRGVGTFVLASPRSGP